MSDPIDDLLRDLRNQRPPAAFAPAEAVRRRGRQRTQRTAVAAGAAVLAVGTAVGFSVAPPGGGGPPQPLGSSGASTPAPAPLPSVSAAPLVLRPIDLGPGDWQVASAEPLEGAPWYWNELCGTATSAALRHQLWVDTVSYRDGPPPARFPDAQPRYTVIVERYGPDWGRQSMADVRNAVGLCDSDNYDAAQSGFAGEESLLVRHRVPGAGDQFIAVVRVGDLVATILVPAGKDAEVARGLARAAAPRLR